jgi:enterobactin synthetase component D / holo-[acyl-carrier protein] synthase
VIERILPAGVRSAYARADQGERGLFPAEEAIVARAVEGRKDEFATIRRCARTALAELGVPPGPILPGVRGAPVWPAGIVGSMTHCVGYRAAAVARSASSGVAGLGIDAEVDGALPGGVTRLVASETEREHVAALGERYPGVHWDRVLFSAKESVYKVWSPMTGEWLDFLEASIEIDPGAGTFSARVLVPGPIGELTGRYLVEDGLVLTAIVI